MWCILVDRWGEDKACVSTPGRQCCWVESEWEGGEKTSGLVSHVLMKNIGIFHNTVATPINTSFNINA